MTDIDGLRLCFVLFSVCMLLLRTVFFQVCTTCEVLLLQSNLRESSEADRFETPLEEIAGGEASTPFFIRPWVDVVRLNFRELREMKMC